MKSCNEKLYFDVDGQPYEAKQCNGCGKYCYCGSMQFNFESDPNYGEINDYEEIGYDSYECLRIWASEDFITPHLG
ncbi:MAG: hypothetical protein ACFFDI_32290 [Promethearchaeota archaeon]